jgi:hypothetical protein
MRVFVRHKRTVHSADRTITLVFGENIMELCRLFESACCLVALTAGLASNTQALAGQITVSGTLITAATGSWHAVSGTAANGTEWASFVTGTTPCAYFDLDSGSLMLDTKGQSFNLFDFKYGTAGTIAITTPGPFVFSSGTGQNAISTSLVERTLPSGSWFAVTTFPARLAGSVSLSSNPGLETSGNNIASTNGWFDLPWSFGAIAPSLVQQQASLYSSVTGSGFRSPAAGGNLLGYGNGIGMFTWTPAAGGTRYGAIVPVEQVPEPTCLMAVGAGVAAVAYLPIRRRRRNSPAIAISAKTHPAGSGTLTGVIAFPAGEADATTEFDRLDRYGSWPIRPAATIANTSSKSTNPL